MMIRERKEGRTFAVRMNKYLGKPFREGAIGPDAYDCVGFIYSCLIDAGKAIPKHWQQWDITNYANLSRGDKKREKAVLREWILSLGLEVNNKLAGDVLLINGLNDILFPAIYTGNNHAIAVFSDHGVRAFSLGNYLQPQLIVRV